MSSTLRSVLTKQLPSSAFSSSHRSQSRDNTPLSWDEFFDDCCNVDIDGDIFNVYLKGTSGPVFYLLHGGGYSGLTWACFAAELSSRIQCQLLVPDLRGHGQTHTKDETDFSTDRQSRDIINIYNAVFGSKEGEPPNVCLVGHSMGGALAIHAVALNEIPNVMGLAVVDVVEGSAMDALSGMLVFLRGRPTTFDSEEKAVAWCLQSGTTRNRQAARISMPSQLRKMDDGKYTWRIDLTITEPYWVGWFQGLSSKFLSCYPPKLLVLAGVDRLDKDLTIAQMQGKFQTTILPKVGHAVQEDSPDRLADELARFAIRHKFAEAVPGSKPIASRPIMEMGMIP
ncbi:hydrolase, alpha/beta domain protein [Dictyocaulus viviparus]|uniref:Protein phosphatase methylesterase 1 n=1 Tax=Dictyocaulus viviparus TaxID=29172 RepID=A0A0D8XWG4_DICVI|nr:hydrolase, alpha/beta domain protein [Dictyocaulus viviparus]